VPSKETSPPSDSNAISTSVAPATTTGDTYTVKGGDSLYRIAVNNKMNLNQLLKLNPTMTAKSLIRAGDKLKIK
jgi:LysM repeat protein